MFEEIARIENAEKVYIYGAGDVAREVAFCLKSEAYGIDIEGFLISDEIKENRSIFGIPVISYSSFDEDKSTLIIVAVLEKYRDEIVANLEQRGYVNHIEVTFESDLWGKVREKFYSSYREKKEGVPFVAFHNGIEAASKSNNKKCRVFVAKSHVDKPLKVDVDANCWEEDIQVGASLTDKEISEIKDNTGKNISEKNRQYCELTALYWIWKNVSDEFVGLCHYRRRFQLSEMDIKKLIDSDIDAVLTVPVLNVPDVVTMYRKNHIYEDWKKMTEVISERGPEYLNSLEYIEKSHFYIPYNMFIMRKNVLDKYCEWLWPILEECEKRCGVKEDRYQNRYIGFLAERLMSVYFYHHRYDLKVVFADKRFYE